MWVSHKNKKRVKDRIQKIDRLKNSVSLEKSGTFNNKKWEVCKDRTGNNIPN